MGVQSPRSVMCTCSFRFRRVTIATHAPIQLRPLTQSTSHDGKKVTTMEVVSKHADRGVIHQCIYCLCHVPVGEFNREHVLSKAFGAFKHAPVLHRCVCR